MSSAFVSIRGRILSRVTILRMARQKDREVETEETEETCFAVEAMFLRLENLLYRPFASYIASWEVSASLPWLVHTEWCQVLASVVDHQMTGCVLPGIVL